MEIKKLRQIVAAGSSTDAIEQRFDLYDADGSEALDVEEFRCVCVCVCVCVCESVCECVCVWVCVDGS